MRFASRISSISLASLIARQLSMACLKTSGFERAVCEWVVICLSRSRVFLMDAPHILSNQAMSASGLIYFASSMSYLAMASSGVLPLPS